jgi:hypothetical protein
MRPPKTKVQGGLSALMPKEAAFKVVLSLRERKAQAKNNPPKKTLYASRENAISK